MSALNRQVVIALGEQIAAQKAKVAALRGAAGALLAALDAEHGDPVICCLNCHCVATQRLGTRSPRCDKHALDGGKDLSYAPALRALRLLLGEEVG